MFRREFYLATGQHIQDMDIVPVVEVWVATGAISLMYSCMVGARPVGFAILTPERGYWLTGLNDLTEFARAVRECATSEDKAS